MTEIERRTATIERIYAAFAEGDWDTWETFIDENSVLIEAESLPYGGRHTGKGVIEALKTLGSVWTDFDYERLDMFHNEQATMVYGIMHATGIATGKRVTMYLAERWVLDGEIVREVNAIYSDTALALTAMG